MLTVNFFKTLALFALFSNTMNAQWTPKVPVENRSLDEIYEAAQQESGPLIVVHGGDAGDQDNAIFEAFQARFPKIDIQWTTDLSKYLDSRIDRAFYEMKETVDVVILQTLHDFPRWKEQNRLLYYKPAVWDDIYTAQKDEDGAYLPLYTFAFGPIKFDSSKVNAADIPSTFEEFIQPQWKSKLVLAYPNDDDAVCYLFSKIVARYGFDWFEALAKNDVLWVRGTHSPVGVIDAAHNNASDPRSITFTTLEGFGPYWQTVLPQPPEQFMRWPQTGAIMASTQRPESSKLLLGYILSDEFQTNSSANIGLPYSPRVSLDAGRSYTESNSEVDGFKTFMVQRNIVDWWRLQFETTLGTAQGPGPLQIYPGSHGPQ